MTTTKNNKYELTVLIDELSTDEQVKNMHNKVRELAGRFLRIAPEDWGIKRLAYPIQRERRHEKARYLYYDLELEGNAPAELSGDLCRDDVSIRHLLVRTSR